MYGFKLYSNYTHYEYFLIKNKNVNSCVCV